MLFKCMRCGFSDKRKSCVLRHLERKKECKSILSCVSREACIEIIKTNDYKLGVKLLLEDIEKLRQINVLQEKDIEINKFKEIIVSMKEEINKLKMSQNPVIEEQTECIYLLLEREFIHNPLKVAKIGRSVCFKNRMNNYPKGSTILCVNKCNDSVKAEKDLIMIFNCMFKHREDIGDEYFEGETSHMIKQINGYFYINT
jgi:hypothetical protein